MIISPNHAAPRRHHQQFRELKIAKPEDILQWYEEPLVARLHADAADMRTRDLLAYLYNTTHERAKLAPLDLEGWKILHKQNYAESYLIHKSSTDADFQAQLKTAMADFPNSAILARLQLRQPPDTYQYSRAALNLAAIQFANVADTNQNLEKSLNDYMVNLSRMVKRDD